MNAAPDPAPRKLTLPEVEFLGEQDGLPERELKRELCRVFTSRPDVARAWLCRVRYGREGVPAVALALLAPEDPGLADLIGQVFRRTFGHGVALDILFVESGTEVRLTKVCTHFFSAD